MAIRIDKIDGCSKFRHQWRGKAITTKELIPTAEAFRRNIERLHYLATLPPCFLGFGAHLQAQWTEAVRLETGRFQFEEGDEDVSGIKGRMPKLTDGLRLCDDDLIRRFRAVTSDITAWEPKEPEIAPELTEAQQEEQSFLDDALDVFLAAQTMLSWTVFEITAGDIAIVVANARTKAVGESVAALPDGHDLKQPTRSIPFWIMEKNQWNVHGKLGSVFADKFLKQRSLEDLRTAYALAFKKDHTVTKIFENSALRALSLTRNVFAHQGGIADGPFVNAISDLGFFSGIAEGEPVALTPALASNFSRVAIDSIIDIFDYVEAWLVKNPD
jgi:hypothetical protein